MSYYAEIKESNIKVVNREGLLNVINESSYSGIEFNDIESALYDFLSLDEIMVNDDGTVELFSNGKYHSDDWEVIAPYIEGYVEYIGEENELWRNVFKDGSMHDECANVSWSSNDAFYTESWYDEDIIDKLNGRKLSSDEMATIKEQIVECFSDLSDRNEQIADIINGVVGGK